MTTVVVVRGPPKPEGWCDEHGIQHAWAIVNELLLTHPPQEKRRCVNCGKTQTRITYRIEAEWT